MLKQIIKLTIKLFPNKIQDRVTENLKKFLYIQKQQIGERTTRLNKNKILHLWEKNGKPVPPPHIVKQMAIKSYSEKYSCKILVETGTFLGEMVYSQKNNFSEIYSIELSDLFWNKSVKRFKKHKHINIIKGDSSVKLIEIIPKLSAKALYWLDGHYSHGYTAKGNKECPILEELNVIFKYNKYNNVILIDDARDFIGIGDYPTLNELTNKIKELNPQYKVEVKDDIIRITNSFS